MLFSLSTDDQINTGKLFLFDYLGNIRWCFKSGKELKYGPYNYSNNFLINGFELNDLDNDGLCEIILVSDQQPYFPTQIVILDLQGNVQGEYWNTGRIMDMVFHDLNRDGIKEIILSGINNEYRQGCLIVLDPRNMTGGSPQISET